MVAALGSHVKWPYCHPNELQFHFPLGAPMWANMAQPNLELGKPLSWVSSGFEIDLVVKCGTSKQPNPHTRRRIKIRLLGNEAPFTWVFWSPPHKKNRHERNTMHPHETTMAMVTSNFDVGTTCDRSFGYTSCEIFYMHNQVQTSCVNTWNLKPCSPHAMLRQMEGLINLTSWSPSFLPSFLPWMPLLRRRGRWGHVGRGWVSHRHRPRREKLPSVGCMNASLGLILPRHWEIDDILWEWNPQGKEERATSHTRLRARDRYTSSTLIGGKGGAGLKFVASHYAWGINGVYMWTQDGCEVYRASNASCIHGHLNYF